MNALTLPWFLPLPLQMPHWPKPEECREQGRSSMYPTWGISWVPTIREERDKNGRHDAPTIWWERVECLAQCLAHTPNFVVFFLIQKWTDGFGQHHRDTRYLIQPQNLSNPFPGFLPRVTSQCYIYFVLRGSKVRRWEPVLWIPPFPLKRDLIHSWHLLSFTEKKRFGQKMLLGILYIENC